MSDNEYFFNRYRHIIHAIERQERQCRNAGLVDAADVYAQVMLDLRKSYSAHIFKRTISSNLSQYLGVLIGMAIFLFIVCGIAEYLVIKLIGG